MPPSSLRLWLNAAPADTDALYLGDFDTQFQNLVFWSYKDSGLPETFSISSVARAGVALAYALRGLASGTPVQSAANETVRPAPTHGSLHTAKGFAQKQATVGPRHARNSRSLAFSRWGSYLPLAVSHACCEPTTANVWPTTPKQCLDI